MKTAVQYEKSEFERQIPEPSRDGDKRSEFERDRSRIVHSTAFRRLQGKTQVFGFGHSDFFRTRLTHSLEVAQISKGIALKTGPADPDLVEAVALAHDIGHPPFAVKSFLKQLKIFDKLNLNIIIENKLTIVNRSSFNTLPFDETTSRLAKDLFNHEFGFGRVDLAEQQSELAYLSLTHEQIIKALKPYLTEFDIGALVAASTVVRLEDKRDAVSKKRSHELLENLKSAYGSRGRKIYNMLRSKVYKGATIFHSIVLPFLEDARKKYPNDLWKVRGIFSAFFDDLLSYYPRAIWMDSPGHVKKRYLKVLGRITKEQIPVSMYARKPQCIKTAEEICRLIINDRPELAILKESYTLGPDVACMFTIIKKETVA